MRRLLAALTLLIFSLIGVLAVRTAILRSRQIIVSPAPALAIDRSAALERFSRAVQYQTVSHSAEDRGREVEHEAFVAWLAQAYPRVHAELQRELVGGRSLLYTWKGSDPASPPILFMGHYDVVPIEPGTEERWAHPPFGGVEVGGFVWGRGTLDDKLTVIGLLEAAESLLGEGFRPHRTVLLSFGHDEEIGGEKGAAAVAALLQSRAVTLDAVVDEGGAVMDGSLLGLPRPVALVGIAEKGAVSVELIAEGTGGHSSMPPPRTEVGAIAAAVDRVQQRPFPASVRGATAEMFRWLAPEMPLGQRLVVSNLWLFKPLLALQARKSNGINAMLRTTTAPTIVSGGVKDNVIPSRARAVINFRILPGDTIEGVVAHVKEAVNDAHVELRVSSESRREPSPVSDPAAPRFAALQRTIGQLFPDALVAPYLVVGGTDSRYFYPLTPNVYRFVPVRMQERDLERAHGIDERVSVAGFFEAIRFYRSLVMNMTGN